MLTLKRKVADILIPPVNVLDDKQAFKQIFDIHCERKMLLDDLVKGGVDYYTVLDACEAYLGTSAMDEFIQQVEPQLDKLIGVDD